MDAVDKLIEKTGADTDVFRNQVKKGLKVTAWITLSSAIIVVVTILAIYNNWWPDNESFRVLAGFILILSGSFTLLGLLSMFCIEIQGFVLNKLARGRKNMQ